MVKDHIWPFASVIIPVYNYGDSLRLVMDFFGAQTYPPDRFELIIINDGSTEACFSNADYWPSLECRVRWIHQPNQGRAAARNAGVAVAEGEYLIFCDADRFPGPDFVLAHVTTLKANKQAVAIGCPWDFFGNLKILQSDSETGWAKIRKLSRKPQYYSKISNLYNEQGETVSQLGWASFLVGNSSLRKSDLLQAGSFNRTFTAWGFEHFELGLRLQKQGLRFIDNPLIANYHIPHPRGEGYYKSMLENSLHVFQQMHPEINLYCLLEYMFGNISLQEFEKRFSGVVSKELQAKEEIFFRAKY